jgi:hypothetical protein
VGVRRAAPEEVEVADAADEVLVGAVEDVLTGSTCDDEAALPPDEPKEGNSPRYCRRGCSGYVAGVCRRAAGEEMGMWMGKVAPW